MSAKLIAEIGADTSGFEAGLNRADAAAGRFAHKVSGKLSSAFGVGFAIGAIARLPSRMIEQAEKISEGAAKLKATTDEYQMLTAAAKDAGMETEEFVKANAKQGVMLDALVKRLSNYRDQIKMTGKEISQWKEIGGYGEAFMSGVSRPINSAIRVAGRLFAGGSDIVGAVGGTLLNGITGGRAGAKPEDYISNFMQRWGLSEKDTGSAALPKPTGYGQTDRLARLTENLRVLDMQEASARSSSSVRSSFFLPGLTDRQEGGAFTQRSSVIVTEQTRTNTILEDIRKEQQDTKEEIRKLRGGE